MPRIKAVHDDDILRAILEVMASLGATQFSLEDCRAKTGLSPATLLQRFGSKKNIMQQAIALANQDLQQILHDYQPQSQSYLHCVVELYLYFAQGLTTRDAVAGGLDILKLDITDPQLNKLTREYFAIRRAKLHELLVLASQHNELSADIDIGELVWNLECFWQGAIMQWALVGKGALKTWLRNRLEAYIDMCK